MALLADVGNLKTFEISAAIPGAVILDLEGEEKRLWKKISEEILPGIVNKNVAARFHSNSYVMVKDDGSQETIITVCIDVMDLGDIHILDHREEVKQCPSKK